MNDETPIFTDDDSVDKEIEANEARAEEPKGSFVEHALDTLASPFTRALGAHEPISDEDIEAHRQNDQEQRSDS